MVDAAVVVPGAVIVDESDKDGRRQEDEEGIPFNWALVRIPGGMTGHLFTFGLATLKGLFTRPLAPRLTEVRLFLFDWVFLPRCCFFLPFPRFPFEPADLFSEDLRSGSSPNWASVK